MRLYPYFFSPISFHFAQSPRDFIVQEIPLYLWSGEGNHLILQVRKKGLSTQEMIKTLCNFVGCKSIEVGCAGLKDKSAITTQFISIPYSFYNKLLQCEDRLLAKGIKILSRARHHNKIRMGHLKGNQFFIRLKKVTAQDMKKISGVLHKIVADGIPNYFGFQRFGKFGDNYIEGKKIIQGEKLFRNKKLSTFLISSYQSYIFNQWLSNRVKFCRILKEFKGQELFLALDEIFHLDISPKILDSLTSQEHFFKIFPGDVLHHYPLGKMFFEKESLQEAILRFLKKEIAPCGLLPGRQVTLPYQLALNFQKDFTDPQIQAIGSYRFAWIFPENLQYKYIKEEAHLELSFFLPKGSYATILIEALANRELEIE